MKSGQDAKVRLVRTRAEKMGKSACLTLSQTESQTDGAKKLRHRTILFRESLKGLRKTLQQSCVFKLSLQM